MDDKDFVYEKFSDNLCEQLMSNLSQNVKTADKVYIADCIKNFTGLAQEALANNYPDIGEQNSEYILRSIAQWVYEAGVIFVRTDFPRMYRDGLMRMIAYTVYQINVEDSELTKDEISEKTKFSLNESLKFQLEQLDRRKAINKSLKEQVLKLFASV